MACRRNLVIDLTINTDVAQVEVDEQQVNLTRVQLPQGRFTTELVTTRTTYIVSPRMFVSTLIQYNSSNETVGANVRLTWEYPAGSELFSSIRNGVTP